MESQTAKRTLTDEDINDIVKVVPSPEGIERELIDDVLEFLIVKYRKNIIGVEDDPEMKNIMARKEADLEHQMAQQSTKLTNKTRLAMHLPSVSEMPKHYTDQEIVEVKRRWVARLTEEVADMFKRDEAEVSRRALTTGEIQRLLKVIDYKKNFTFGNEQGMDPAVAKAVEASVKEDILAQIRGIRIVPARFDRLLELFEIRFKRSLALNGKWVGNIAGASFGAAATQSSLNTFHFAGDRGARKVVTGFAMFERIIDVTFNQQGTAITAFTKRLLSPDQMRMMSNRFELSVVEDFIESYEVLEVTPETPTPKWEYIHNIVCGIRGCFDLRDRYNIQKPDTILSIQLNRIQMYFRRISIYKIAKAIEESSADIRVVISSMHKGIIYIYHKIKDIVSLIKKPGGLPESALENPMKYFLTNVVYEMVKRTYISGIPGVIRADVRKYEIQKAIDRSNIKILRDDVRTIQIPFEKNAVYTWALTEEILSNFIRLRLLHLARGKIDISYDLKTTSISFGTTNLAKMEDGKYVQVGKDDILSALDKAQKVTTYSLIDFGNPLMDPIRKEGEFIFVKIDPRRLNLFQLKMDSIILSVSEALLLKVQTDDLFHLILSNAGDSEIDFDIGSIAKSLQTIFHTSRRSEDVSLRWYYDIEGTNYSEVMSHPEIDHRYTRTNNIITAYQILGVENCRAITLSEIDANTSDGLNPVHTELLADALLSRPAPDKPNALSRTGMARRKAPLFVKASYEMNTDNLLRSAASGETDNLESLPSRMVMGLLGDKSKLREEDRAYVLSDKRLFGIDMPLVQTSKVQVVKAHLPDTITVERKGKAKRIRLRGKKKSGKRANRRKK